MAEAHAAPQNSPKRIQSGMNKQILSGKCRVSIPAQIKQALSHLLSIREMHASNFCTIQGILAQCLLMWLALVDLLVLEPWAGFSSLTLYCNSLVRSICMFDTEWLAMILQCLNPLKNSDVVSFSCTPSCCLSCMTLITQKTLSCIVFCNNLRVRHRYMEMGCAPPRFPNTSVQPGVGPTWKLGSICFREVCALLSIILDA